MPADNRTVFLEAGEALLAESATETTMRSLTVRAITKRARRSTGAFYHYWDTQADYIRDLVPYLMRWEAAVDGDPVIDRIQRVAPTEMDAAMAMKLFDASIAALTTTPAGRFIWLLFSMVDDVHVASSLRRLYDEYAEVYAAAYERVFGGCGLRPADGMSWLDVAALLTAALDGVTMRQVIDPERGGPKLAARMIAAVMTGALVPADAPDVPLLERLDDLLTRHRPATLA